MQKLITELKRLYLLDDAPLVSDLAARLQGQPAPAASLCGGGFTRALVLPFPKGIEAGEAAHWHLLCEVANKLQSALGLPAPAVSISGADGFALWLSLETPVPLAQAQQFIELVSAAWLPERPPAPDAAARAAELPPALHAVTGKWAAFIHPGLGASFADDAGLDAPPPLAGQIALLENLDSITAAQFDHALRTLQPAAAAQTAPIPARPASGLLLQDATLEDIVRHLQSRQIEPTFRFLTKTK
jgi:hypothetical protein